MGLSETPHHYSAPLASLESRESSREGSDGGKPGREGTHPTHGDGVGRGGTSRFSGFAR